MKEEEYSPRPGHGNSFAKAADHLRNWLVAREYVPLWHFLAVAVIIGFACLLFFQHFRTPGSLIHADQAFPFTVDRIAGQVNNTWLQYGGFQIISFIEMAPWTLSYVVIAKIFGLSQPQYLLVMFISTFALAGVSMYALSYSTIKSVKAMSGRKIGLFAGSVLAGIVYMYNPWSLFSLWPFMMYVAFALIPLIFMLLRRIFEGPKLWHVVSLVLIIWLASSHPTCISWIWIMIAAYTLFYLLVNKFARRSLITAAKVFFGTLILYVLANAAWTVPYAAAKMTGIPMGPNYAPFLNRAALDGLSQSGTLANNLRLVSGYGQFVIPGANNGLNIVLSYALPVFALLCLVMLGKRLRRNGTFLFWALFAVISLLFATGSTYILRRFYSYLVLRAPGAATFGWLFRSPNRMLYGVPLFYALSIGFLVAWLLRGVPRAKPTEAARREGAEPPDDRLFDFPEEDSKLLEEKLDLRRRLGRYANYKYYGGILLVIVITVLTLLSFYPRGLFYAQYIFDPTKIPADYKNVDNYITRQAGDARIMWLPFISLDHMTYTWAPAKRIPPINVYSGNPNLDDMQELYNNDSYFIWLSNLLQVNQWPAVQLTNKDVTLSRDIASKLFIPFSAKYLIFDSSIAGFNFGDALKSDQSLQETRNTDFLTVYKTLFNVPLIRAARRTVKADSFFDNLAISQRFPGDVLGNIAFVDQKPVTPSFTAVDKMHGLVDINDYKEYAAINSGFEKQVNNGKIPDWKVIAGSPPAVTVSVDNKEKAGGHSSLKITNQNQDTQGLAWVQGVPILVRQGDIFTFSTAVKYRNASWSNATMEGFQDSTLQWITLVQCPTARIGTSNWRHYECSFYVPKGISAIRPALCGGYSYMTALGPGVTWFDDVKISRLRDSFYSEVFAPTGPPKVTFKKISAEKYKVHVSNAREPFVLVFGEAFDPFWVARMPDVGKVIQPAPLYSTINGFQMDRIGSYDLTIEYPPQSWYHLGLLVAVPVLLLCLAFVIYAGLIKREAWEWRALKSGAVHARKGATKVREYLGERSQY